MDEGQSRKRILIVANRGFTSIGMSFVRAAGECGLDVLEVDAACAQSSFRLTNKLHWHLLDRRPARLTPFGNALVRTIEDARPTYLLTTGLSPVSAETVRAARERGVVCLHFSTDDPWNPTQLAKWHLRALREYNLLFTPRRSNVADLEHLAGGAVHYLPFGFDAAHFGHETLMHERQNIEALFVGGADSDRVRVMQGLLACGIRVTLVGGYWNRYGSVARHSLGIKPPEEVASLTRRAMVNLCLVRRANRDGHVMRSYEIAALGGCMLVEATAEHRAIFGREGECVMYFESTEEAAAKIRRLLADDLERARLGCMVRRRIAEVGANSYTDRLQSMLNAAATCVG